VPLSAIACTWERALSCWACATSTARLASSRRDALTNPCATSACCRSRSAVAARNVAAACSSAALLALRPVLRRPARRACACRSEALACASAARNSSGSNRTSRAPWRTCAPSRTVTSATRPVIVAPMSTRESAATRAEKRSVRNKGLDCTSTTSTGVPRSCSAANARSPMRMAAPTRIQGQRFMTGG
jgi:hypothetical protein